MYEELDALRKQIISLKEERELLIAHVNQVEELLENVNKHIESIEKQIHHPALKPETLFDRLVRGYPGNPWPLRIKALSLPAGEERTAYERAYYTILDKKGSWIGLNAKIASCPVFPHSMLGIFISNNAKIGKNVVIFQQVTIGSNTLEGSKTFGSPTIGDNVYIGAGAKIIGNIKVGNNCRIGANAVVVNDVPDDSIVVLEKPRIIHKENMDNRFIQWRNGQKGYWYDEEFHVL